MTGESKRPSAPQATPHPGQSHAAGIDPALAVLNNKAIFGDAWKVWTAPALITFAAAFWLQMQAPQRELFLSLNHWAAQVPSMVWSVLTTLGDASVLFCILSPLLVWRPQMMFAVLAAVPVGGLLSVSLKALFQAQRPATVINPDQFNVIGPLLNNASFPSGHTITAFAAALALAATVLMQVRHRIALSGVQSDGDSNLRSGLSALAMVGVFVAVGAAAMVGFSRVAVGAHWPVDVLAGAACGWLAGLSGAWAAQRFTRLWKAPISQFAVGQLLLFTALWLLLKKPEYPQGAPAVWLAVVCVLVSVVWQFVAMYRRLRASRSNSTKAASQLG